MASNKKITELTANTTPALTDILPMVDDPSGTPATQKVALTYIAELIRNLNLVYAGRELKQIQNSSAENSIAPAVATGSLTLAANYLTQGKTLRLIAAGYIDSVGSPTLTIKFKIGATTVLNSGAITVGADYNKVSFRMEVNLTMQDTGSGANYTAQGIIFIGTTVVPFSADSWSTVNTTITNALSVTAQFSAADNGNSLVISNYTVEAIN